MSRRVKHVIRDVLWMLFCGITSSVLTQAWIYYGLACRTKWSPALLIGAITMLAEALVVWMRIGNEV